MFYKCNMCERVFKKEDVITIYIGVWYECRNCYKKYSIKNNISISDAI